MKDQKATPKSATKKSGTKTPAATRKARERKNLKGTVPCELVRRHDVKCYVAFHVPPDQVQALGLEATAALMALFDDLDGSGIAQTKGFVFNLDVQVFPLIAGEEPPQIAAAESTSKSTPTSTPTEGR